MGPQEYSIYDDGTFDVVNDQFVFLGWSSIEDSPPPGCDHYDYYTTTTVTSPTGSNSLESSGASSNASLEVTDSDEGSWNIGTSGYLTCSCAGTTLNFAGSSGLSFDWEFRSAYLRTCTMNALGARYLNYNCSAGTSSTCAFTPYQTDASVCYSDIRVVSGAWRRGTGGWHCTPGIVIGHNVGSGLCT
jgi:hypothetical protein